MTEDATFEALQLRVEIGEDEATRYYNNENELHRVHGPAVVFVKGTKFWFLNGKNHRTDGPAIEYAWGDKCWFINGERHRTDGPAIIYANGTKMFCINGEILTKKDFLSHPLCTIK